MKWRSVVHQARPSPGHSHPDAAPMIDMAQAVTCERSPGSTKSRLRARRRSTIGQVDGSTIRQRGEAERTRKHALDTNESYLIHPPRCIFHCPMITYRAVTTIHSVTLHVFTDARTGDILGPPCPINHLYPLNFVPSALRLHRLGGTACFFSLGRQLGACHVGATGVPTRPSCSRHRSNARLLLLLRLHGATTTTTNALQRLRRWPLLKLGKVKLQMLDLLRHVSRSCHVLARHTTSQGSEMFRGESGDR
jgi:hypothetical protein